MPSIPPFLPLGDCLGPYDRGRLERVSSGKLVSLQLDPLSKPDVERILSENHGIADPEGIQSRMYP